MGPLFMACAEAKISAKLCDLLASSQQHWETNLVALSSLTGGPPFLYHGCSEMKKAIRILRFLSPLSTCRVSSQVTCNFVIPSWACTYSASRCPVTAVLLLPMLTYSTGLHHENAAALSSAVLVSHGRHLLPRLPLQLLCFWCCVCCCPLCRKKKKR